MLFVRKRLFSPSATNTFDDKFIKDDRTNCKSRSFNGWNEINGS